MQHVLSGVPVVEIKSLFHCRHTKGFFALRLLLPDALGKSVS